MTAVDPKANRRGALAVLTTLFFTWGFLTCLNDVLIPHLKAAFALSFTEAALVQFSFFTAYALVSVPAGALVARIGYSRGIVLGIRRNPDWSPVAKEYVPPGIPNARPRMSPPARDRRPRRARPIRHPRGSAVGRRWTRHVAIRP